MMIGDWVWLVEPEDGHKKLVRIIRSDLGPDGMRYLEPVELTEEIMAKNFPDYEEGYEIGWWPNPIGGYQVAYKDPLCTVIMKDVHYVHEIQHLLKLIGSGKEIEIWHESNCSKFQKKVDAATIERLEGGGE